MNTEPKRSAAAAQGETAVAAEAKKTPGAGGTPASTGSRTTPENIARLAPEVKLCTLEEARERYWHDPLASIAAAYGGELQEGTAPHFTDESQTLVDHVVIPVCAGEDRFKVRVRWTGEAFEHERVEVEPSDVDAIIARPVNTWTDSELAAVKAEQTRKLHVREIAGEEKALAGETLQRIVEETGSLSELELKLRSKDLLKKYGINQTTLDLIWRSVNPEKTQKPSGKPEAPVKDLGHASVLAGYFTNRFRWAPHRNSWMEYTGKYWRPVEEERVAKVAADTLRAEYAKRLSAATEKIAIAELLGSIRETCVFARVAGALSFLRGWDGILTRSEEWDRNPWLLNVENCTVNLRNGKSQKHLPEDLITKLAPVDFVPGADGPTWSAHVERFLPDSNIRRQVQRDLGVALVGESLDEMLPIWYGTGANGKSTTSKVLRRVLGGYVGEAAPNLLIQTKFESHPTEIADLASLRIVFSSEIGKDKRLDEERAKRLTGGDVLKGRFMRADFFEFPQTFTIFMEVNHHPGITGTDHAVWRRVRLCPWTVAIPEKDRLPQEEIVNLLCAEGPAILAWLLAGLADWQKDKGWIAPEVRAATSAYRAEQDRLSAFLKECCEEAPHYTVTVATLYAVYMTWCVEEGEEPLGKTAFGNQLRESGKTSKKNGHDKISTWFGLRLVEGLRTRADPLSYSPLENQQSPDEHETESAQVRTEAGDALPF